MGGKIKEVDGEQQEKQKQYYKLFTTTFKDLKKCVDTQNKKTSLNVL